MAVTLTNDQLRYAGRKILLYRPRPAADAFHRSPAKVRWLFGGNRSGKSEANVGFDLCAFALGLHPYRVTPKNATIWAAANSWDLVGKLLWSEKIKAYLPMGQIQTILWHNKSAEIPKEIRLCNGNRIEFKAYEQTRKAFEGRAIDAFYGDEQCQNDSEGIWTEIQARLLDRGGFSAQSMTPIIHQPWLMERIRAHHESDDIFYANLEDNRRSRGGFVPDAEIDNLIAQWPEEIRETRVKGYFASFMGAVFKTFSRDVHVCKPFKIPEDWPRWRSIDLGYNNPLAALWVARNDDGCYFVYREHYAARESLSFHAEKIRGLSGRERYRATWCDHDSQDRHELANLGIETSPARKSVHLGIEALQTVLKIQPNGLPRLQIFSTCRHCIEEVEGYRWAEGSEIKDARDEPLKIRDHCVDALRYVVFAEESSFLFRNADMS